MNFWKNWKETGCILEKFSTNFEKKKNDKYEKFWEILRKCKKNSKKKIWINFLKPMKLKKLERILIWYGGILKKLF